MTGDEDGGGVRGSGRPSDKTLLFHSAGDLRVPSSTHEEVLDFQQQLQVVAAAFDFVAAKLDAAEMTLADFDGFVEQIGSAFEANVEFNGEQYEETATAYLRGDRDDGHAAYAAYLYDLEWFLQEAYNLHDECIIEAIAVRYPDSFVCGATVLDAPPEGMSAFKVPEGRTMEGLDYGDVTPGEVDVTQPATADGVREIAARTRAEYPHPEDGDVSDDPRFGTPREAHRHGGMRYVVGRSDQTAYLHGERLETDPDRFDGPIEEPEFVAPLTSEAPDEVSVPFNHE